MTDAEIIKLILQGDKEKFALLVGQYQKLVFRTCMGFLHDKDDSEDLTQDVFIQAYQSLPRFRGNAAFSTWLYRIAVNASLNKIRKSPLMLIKQQFDNFAGDKKEGELSVPLTDGEDPETIMIRDEHVKWVQRALDSLPENQRTAIVLSKYDDLPQKEIAEIMDTTEGAVEALLQRAKKNLYKKLAAQRRI